MLLFLKKKSCTQQSNQFDYLCYMPAAAGFTELQFCINVDVRVDICNHWMLVFIVAEGNSIFLSHRSYSLWEAATVLSYQNWSQTQCVIAISRGRARTYEFVWLLE